MSISAFLEELLDVTLLCKPMCDYCWPCPAAVITGIFTLNYFTIKFIICKVSYKSLIELRRLLRNRLLVLIAVSVVILLAIVICLVSAVLRTL